MKVLPTRQRLDVPGAESRSADAPIWQVCTRRLWENNVTAMSAGLSFRTIFALVPLLVLAFLLLKTVGILENSKRSLRTVLETSGFSKIVLVEADATGAASAPASGTPAALAGHRVVNVAEEIERLVDRVEQKLSIGAVGPIGFLLLVYTATTLLTSMERSLNRIFGAPRSRPLFRRLPLYWSVMTLGPILLTAGTYMGGEVTRSLEATTGVSRMLAILAGWPAPLLACLLVLWALYKLLPNTEVPWQSALAGAAVATPVWLIARWGLALYVSAFVQNGNLYGVLGLIPLSLVWLNLSWLIVLFGAELASMAAESRRAISPSRARTAGLRPSDLLAALVAVGGPFEEGRGPVSARRVGNELRVSEEVAARLLDVLTEMRLIYAVRGRSGAGYVLARPAAAIAVTDIMHAPDANAAELPYAYRPAVMEALRRFQERARSSMGSLTLADLLAIHNHRDGVEKPHALLAAGQQSHG